MPGTLVRSVILSGAEAKLRALGQRPEAVAAAAGVPVAALRDPDLRVTGRAVMQFFDLAAQMCAHRNFGLELSVGNRLAAIIGSLWVLLRHARTVGERCDELARNYDLYSSAALMHFERADKVGILSWSAASGQADSEVQIAEFALGIFVSEIRVHAPRDWAPVEVWFRHQPPRDLRLHRRLFGPRLRFNADHNALLLDEAVMARPLNDSVPGNKALVRMIVRHGEDLPTTAVSPQVEGIIRALLPFAPCGIDDVAKAMGVSVRTLQKQLEATGEGFRAIKDAVRSDLAGKYLRHSQMSATDIAALLGYADLTSFSRAYRRWNDRSIRASRPRLR